MKPVSIALAGSRGRRPPGLEGLRRRLAGVGGDAQDAVLLDFVEDELHESQRALDEIGDYLARVGALLRDPMTVRQQLFALASHFRPAQELEYLEATLGRLRRRLAEVSGRLPDAR